MSILLKTKNLQIGIDSELHKEFKIAVAKNSKSLKEVIIELIKYYIIQTNLKEQNNEISN
jgi:hypothetical protein